MNIVVTDSNNVVIDDYFFELLEKYQIEIDRMFSDRGQVKISGSYGGASIRLKGELKPTVLLVAAELERLHHLSSVKVG